MITGDSILWIKISSEGYYSQKTKGGGNRGKKLKKSLLSWHKPSFPLFHLPSSRESLQVSALSMAQESAHLSEPRFPLFASSPVASPQKKILGMGGTGQGGNRKDLDKYAQASSDKQPYSNRPQQLNNALCLNSLPSNSNLIVFKKDRDITQVFWFSMWEGANVYITKTCLSATDPPTAQGRTEKEALKAASSKHDKFTSKNKYLFHLMRKNKCFSFCSPFHETRN